ncbi:MAG: glycoside hydrolase family 3 N-terminal domain-containing protein [Microbacterium sp.]
MIDHLDPRRRPDERAAALIGQMTLEEKCHQLAGVMPWALVRADGSDAPALDELLTAPPGHVAQLILDDPAELAATVAGIQRRFLDRTRLRIPALFHAEALNGFLAGGHMVFPTAIGLAAAWSPDLVEDMAALIRTQMIRTGMRHALSPVMDVALDPRWGRVHETYGEDPYLVAANSVAYTRGLQGQDLSSGVIATGKHFLGYANPESGLNNSFVPVGPRRLRDLFGYPFEAAIREAGLGSVMNTYSEIDGVPVAASREILTTLLREVMGFQGFVSADYGSIAHLVSRQEVASDLGEAARLALMAGLDVEFPITQAYGAPLVDEVMGGRLDAAIVDAAVARVLEKKFAVGLFEHPYPAESIDVAAVATEGAELSRELAARGVVLLENDGTLPLQPGLRLAVVGPHADAPDLQFATYTYPSWRTAVDAIHLGATGTMVGADPLVDDWFAPRFEHGQADRLPRERYGTASIADALAACGHDVQIAPGSGLTTRLDDSDLAAAVDAARSADLTVLALGGSSQWFSGERTEGEASDTADIDLPAVQRELLEAVAATGRPFIIVLVQGRPYVLPPVAGRAAALLISSYAGPFGGRAVADVVSGRAEPGGRLPYSIPRHTGQVPVYHHQKVGSGYRNALPPGVMNHYLDMPGTPAYPFGAGLTYTSFELSELVAPADVTTDGEASVRAVVTNNGDRHGTAVIQLYARVRTSGITRPHQQLAGFVRVPLEPGASARLCFVVDATLFAATDADNSLTVGPGTVDFAVGRSSIDDGLVARSRLSGPKLLIDPARRRFFSGVTISPVD